MEAWDRKEVALVMAVLEPYRMNHVKQWSHRLNLNSSLVPQVGAPSSSRPPASAAVAEVFVLDDVTYIPFRFHGCCLWCCLCQDKISIASEPTAQTLSGLSARVFEAKAETPEQAGSSGSIVLPCRQYRLHPVRPENDVRMIAWCWLSQPSSFGAGPSFTS